MTALVDERREQFKKNIAELGIDAARPASGGKGRIVGLVLMIVGVVAAFVVYVASLTLSDLRDIASYQLLSIGFVTLTLVGVAVFIASTVSRVLSLWLVRQLLESDAQATRIAEALKAGDN
ncbi:MAG: hypothetical protein GXY65_06635 [Rhodococcus sp.]|uniref:hypothetical protein n=1 Tax=Rhodococcus sp. TaxID=1831 RepID=UPI00169C67DD|nr:hypothetical protein [Rhodococcus sp. (in: high G+C Gram-positive bacteria)]NLV79013.1 hypothetical protein [Rhodococcus sp. (in: high G+C Gram-positive bacteria)]